jgi:SAM-dependent methyltransferase
MLDLERQNRLREQYRAHNPGWQPATERFAALVRQHLTAESRVLDIGCGRGGLVEQLAHPLAQVIGVDPDRHSLAEHRLPLPRAVALSRRLPLPDGAVDVAYAAWVLEHVADPAADLREIRRVLRPGGVFVFITPNRRHPLIQLNRVTGRLTRIQTTLVSRLYGRAPEDTFPAYYRANDPAALPALARLAGLQVATVEAIPDPTYLAFTPALFRLLIRLEHLIPASRKLHLVGSFVAV